MLEDLVSQTKGRSFGEARSRVKRLQPGGVLSFNIPSSITLHYISCYLADAFIQSDLQ